MAPGPENTPIPDEDRTARQPDRIDVHVGTRVKAGRTGLRMSQEKLGEQLGLTFQQIQKYEKGTNRIGAGRLYRLSQVLQVPIQFFFDGLPEDSGPDATAEGFAEGNPTSYVYDFAATPEGVQLAQTFRRITNPVVRRRLLDLIQSLADTSSDNS